MVGSTRRERKTDSGMRRPRRSDRGMPPGNLYSRGTPRAQLNLVSAADKDLRVESDMNIPEAHGQGMQSTARINASPASAGIPSCQRLSSTCMIPALRFS